MVYILIKYIYLHIVNLTKTIMRVKFLLLVLLVCPAMGQDIPVKEMQTEIKEVTVFMNGAQVFRNGTVNLSKGESVIKVQKLSAYLDGKSIQIKGDGDFTILSVNHSKEFSEELKNNKSIDSLRKLITIAGEKISQNNALLSVLKDKQEVLDTNIELNKEQGSGSVENLKLAVNYFEGEYRKIRLSELDLKKENGELEVRKEKLNDQIKEIEKITPELSSQIAIKVKSERGGRISLNINYLVSGASWFPKYDVRVKSIEDPVSLTYKAEISQNTGVDWNNVKLRFSNATPTQSGILPKLTTWYLNYPRYTPKPGDIAQLGLSNGTVSGIVTSAEDGMALPGVNVVVKGTTIGTVTNVDGKYTLTLPTDAEKLVFSFVGMVTKEAEIKGSEINIAMQTDVTQLSEVAVLGYGISEIDKALSGRTPGVRIRGNSSLSLRQGTLSVTSIENQTTFEFEIAEPYTIKSGDDKIMIAMKEISIPALYEYFAAPKLDKDAFLVAKIPEWDQYHLLEGETNLFFEDAFVGRTILNAKSLDDTLDISLGRDKNILITRTLEDKFSKRRVLGANRVESRGFKVMIRNKKSSAINISIIDQIPVSAHSDINVIPLELSNGDLDKDSGLITWELKLEPGSQKEFLLKYEVKCPKTERLVLE